MSFGDESSLLLDLKAARQVSTGCVLCGYIESLPPGELREALTSAAAGSMGGRTLEEVLAKNGIPGRRDTINKHRREGHNP